MPKKTQREQKTVEGGLVESLAPIGSRPTRREFRRLQKPAEFAETNFENRLWLLVHSLKPESISVGAGLGIELKDESFRPNVIGVFEHSILIIAGKYTDASSFITDWISDYKDVRRQLHGVLTRKYPDRSVVVVLAVKDIRNIQEKLLTEIQNIHVKVIDEREINYYESLQKAVGVGVGHIFWGRIKPDVPSYGVKRLPCLRSKNGKKEVYIFSAHPYDILCRAFISHREVHEPEKGIIGYQRMLQKKKLSEIAHFIQSGKSFPTPIVVAFTKKAGEVFEPYKMEAGRSLGDETGVVFGHLRLPTKAGSIQIIDGQHRLFGYSKVPSSKEQVIQVVAHKHVADLDPATMFVEINSKQTSVKSGLLWELYPDIYDPDDELYYLALISKAVEASAEREIPERMQYISRGTKGPITFQSLCNETKKAGFIAKEGGILYSVSGANNETLRQNLETILTALFGALLDLGKEAPNVNEVFILTNNGIIPVIRVIARVIRCEMLPSVNLTNLSRRPFLEDTFKKYLKPVYNYYGGKSVEELNELRRRRSSNSGHNQTDDEMTDKIRREFRPNFPYRPGRVPQEFTNLVQTVSALADNVNTTAQFTGKISSWVFREFNQAQFRKSLERAIDSDADLTYFLGILYNEFIEGSGKDSPDNRIKQILGLSKVYDVQIIDDINTLRIFYAHKTTQLDPRTKQQAVSVLRELSTQPTLFSPHELEAPHYQQIAKRILERLKSELLDKLLETLKK